MGNVFVIMMVGRGWHRGVNPTARAQARACQVLSKADPALLAGLSRRRGSRSPVPMGVRARVCLGGGAVL